MRRQSLPANLVQNCSFLLQQSQVILQLPRVLKRINLGLAVRSQCKSNPRRKHLVRTYKSIAKITLRRRARADRRLRLRQHRNLLCRHVNAMYRGEVRPKNLLSSKQVNRRRSILANARRIFRHLFRNMHMNWQPVRPRPSSDLMQFAQRHRPDTVRSNAKVNAPALSRNPFHKRSHIR